MDKKSKSIKNARLHDEDASTCWRESSAPHDSPRPAASPLFSPGDRLADRYEIERLIGEGGMGVVYQARDQDLSIAVALKTLRFDVQDDRDSLVRLKREVLLSRAVTHPHVCRIYDLGRDGKDASGVWFMTMELLRGETLRDRLRKRGRFPIEVARPLADQMAAGLAAAHRAGVVHRDFKPENVMIVGDPDGERVVITDFGVARPPVAGLNLETRLTSSGVILGTPAYMSPEQLRGDEAGPAADVYALGVVLFEMVTGRLPFVGKTAVEVAARKLVEDAPSPCSFVPELGKPWEETILRCLARAPGSRFAQAEEVAKALSGGASLSAPGVPRVVRVRLPAERESFVGREVELEQLEERFRGSRLVTLLGAGGMGKTRLAVRYGWRSLERWPDGVWFCDLTEARSRDGIVSAVAGSLGVSLSQSDTVKELGRAIAGRGRCLLILDNFEQVVDQTGETVGSWLEQAEEARFLVTSRERLNLPGEEVQAVEPLSIDLGMELFLTRAQQARPGLELTGEELNSAREVVGLVEGMPLAIELAAARMRLMSPAQLVARMRQRFKVLSRAGRGRHATLRATIAGSWELLRPWEKVALAQCAVFEGGFTLEAAEAVIAVAVWPDAPWVVDIVQSLVDKSLLRILPSEGLERGRIPEARFGMYASIQEYAREKLNEEGTERAAEERHGAWFARYGKGEMLSELDLPDGVLLRQELAKDFDNVVAACRRAVARGDGETASFAYRAACAVLNMRGPFGAGIELGREVLAVPLEPVHRARLLSMLGWSESSSGRVQEAHAHYTEALAIYRTLGYRREEGELLGYLAGQHSEQGRVDEALHLYEAALAIYRECGERRGEASLLGNLGNLYGEHGRFDEARAHHRAALAIYRQMGNRRLEGVVLGSMGDLEQEQGRMEEAKAHFDSALAIFREAGDRRFEGSFLGYLGRLHLEQGRLEEARSCCLSALAIDREVGNRRAEATALRTLGLLYLEEGREDEARDHLEAALAIRHDVRDRSSSGAVLGDLGRLHLENDRIDEAREALASAESLLREVGAPIGLGRVLCRRAELELRDGNSAAARLLQTEAEALAAQIGVGPDSGFARELAKLHHGHAEPFPRSDEQSGRDRSAHGRPTRK